eukprot:7029173-Ditylum_brightwellii.AAC.1
MIVGTSYVYTCTYHVVFTPLDLFVQLAIRRVFLLFTFTTTTVRGTSEVTCMGGGMAGQIRHTFNSSTTTHSLSPIAYFILPSLQHITRPIIITCTAFTGGGM